jgi:hypothetical protein
VPLPSNPLSAVSLQAYGEILSLQAESSGADCVDRRDCAHDCMPIMVCAVQIDAGVRQPADVASSSMWQQAAEAQQ